jgi:hypothetical protein
LAIKANLHHLINRLPDNRKPNERRGKKPLLSFPIYAWQQNNQAGMKLLPGIQLEKVADVVGNHDKITGDGVLGNAPVLPSGFSDERDMLGVMASLVCDGY